MIEFSSFFFSQSRLCNSLVAWRAAAAGSLPLADRPLRARGSLRDRLLHSDAPAGAGGGDVRRRATGAGLAGRGMGQGAYAGAVGVEWRVGQVRGGRRRCFILHQCIHVVFHRQ